MLKDESKLISELKLKNEKAFDTIYKEYYKLVFYVINQIVNDYETANELTSDTFVDLYNHIEQHDVNKSFKYWLITIAKNNAKRYLRDNKNKRAYIDSEYINKIPDYDKTHLLDLCKAILTPLEYDILNLHVVFNMTFVEIGQLHDISKSEIHRIYKKTLAKLRQEL